MDNVQKEACLHGQPSHHVVSLQRIPKVDACQMLKAIGSIEKKTFPASEAMKIDTSLLTKANHNVFVLVSADQPHDPLGYAITAQHRHALLMHKICIAPHHRRSKLGMMLLDHLVCIANKSTCRSIELWVDEAREPARCLYSSAGFGELHHVKDYYGPGRNGVKDVVTVEMMLEVKSHIEHSPATRVQDSPLQRRPCFTRHSRLSTVVACRVATLRPHKNQSCSVMQCDSFVADFKLICS